MARTYGAFDEDAEMLLRQPHGHVSRVTVEPSHMLPIAVDDFELSFDECTVTIDESNTVLYVVNMSGPAPSGTLQIEALSELAPPHLVIEAGYEWPGGNSFANPDGKIEMDRIATVYLRTINFENGRYTLTAMSAEALAEELDIGDHIAYSGATPDTMTLNGWLSEIIGLGSPYTANLQGGLPFTGALGYLNALTYERGVSAMKLITDVAGRFGLWIHTVPSGVRLGSVWTFEPKPEPTGSDDEISLTLDRSSAGHMGIATKIHEFRNRDEFYNRVVHTWWWKNGETDFEFTAYADALDPLHLAGGTKTYYERLNAGTDADGARNSVRAKLRNLLSRSLAFEIEAVSAYWLTPGQFVEVPGVTGPSVIAHVRRVTFNLATHEMSVATRMPNIPDSDVSSSI